jgi:hypothetical protein
MKALEPGCVGRARDPLDLVVKRIAWRRLARGVDLEVLRDGVDVIVCERLAQRCVRELGRQHGSRQQDRLVHHAERWRPARRPAAAERMQTAAASVLRSLGAAAMADLRLFGGSSRRVEEPVAAVAGTDRGRLVCLARQLRAAGGVGRRAGTL